MITGVIQRGGRDSAHVEADTCPRDVARQWQVKERAFICKPAQPALTACVLYRIFPADRSRATLRYTREKIAGPDEQDHEKIRTREAISWSYEREDCGAG